MSSSFLKPDLVRDEGERHVCYRDTKGYPTWGIGHKDLLAHVGQIFSSAQIDAAFNQDVATAEGGISHALPWFKDLSSLRQDCLVNMAFNLGVHGLLEFDTFLGFMQRKKYAQATLDLRGTPWFHQVGDRANRICQQIISNTHQN